MILNYVTLRHSTKNFHGAREMFSKRCRSSLHGKSNHFSRATRQRQLVSNSLVIFLALILFSNMPIALGEGIEECVNRKVDFDGIEGLIYAKVTGETQAHLQLFSSYPPRCDQAVMQECTTHPTVESGDDVAIAKSCGGWSFVEDISHAKTRVGWIRDELLTAKRTAVPEDQGDPGGIHHPQSFLENPRTIPIRLTKGAGLSVCEAYLQRLNLTVFHEPPPCGIPENDGVPGFAFLNRIPLSAKAVNSMYIQAANIVGDRYTPLTAPLEGSTGAIAVERSGSQVLHSVKAMKDSEHISVWRFHPKVDVTNDGSFDVVIWRDFPPTWVEPNQYNAACGQIGGGSGASGIADFAVPFILRQSEDEIDVERTMKIFGIETPPTKGAVSEQPGQPGTMFYTPTGSATDIFEFLDQYYFDSTPQKMRFDQRPIEIFWWHRHERHMICEYRSKQYTW